MTDPTSDPHNKTRDDVLRAVQYRAGPPIDPSTLIGSDQVPLPVEWGKQSAPMDFRALERMRGAMGGPVLGNRVALIGDSMFDPDLFAEQIASAMLPTDQLHPTGQNETFARAIAHAIAQRDAQDRQPVRCWACRVATALFFALVAVAFVGLIW